MILFMNVGLFDAKIHGATQNRENAKSYNKVEVFKYSLASLSNYFNWSKVIIYYQLGEEYKHQELELQNFIEEEFQHCNLITRNYRNNTQSEWQNSYELLDDNLIMFLCNHDHIVLDSNSSYFESIIDDIKDTDELISFGWSHWPEYLSHPWIKHMCVSDIELRDKYMKYKVIFDINSINIISKKLYHHWWFANKLPELNFFRPDHFHHPIWQFGEFESHKTIIPYKEIGRHFDGYQHCFWKFTNDKSPVIEIPNGFFENDIRINYSSKYIDGMTNINPLDEKLRIFSESGFDYNFHKEFIPLFWKKRISEFKDDLRFLSDLYPNQKIKENYIQRIMNTWKNMPCDNRDIQIQILNKVFECHNKI